jgi:hypothetical protein
MNKTTGTIVGLVVITAVTVFALNRPVQAPGENDPEPSSSTAPLTSQSALSNQNVIITSPTVNAVVTNPITLTGKNRAFEGSFQYVLRDTSGKIWFQSTGQAGAPDENYYRDFSVKIPVTAGAPRDLIIEVFEYSAMDGSIINLARVPVRLSTLDTTTVQVYLHNRRLNGNDVCDVVFPVNRTVIKTNEPAYLSLYELLRGPIGSDKDNQYYTSIPEGVKINSLKIVNGIAYADFDATLEYQVGGSCRVQAIRTQITNTLKQFTSVRNVIISVNGRVDDALQP